MKKRFWPTVPRNIEIDKRHKLIYRRARVVLTNLEKLWPFVSRIIEYDKRRKTIYERPLCVF